MIGIKDYTVLREILSANYHPKLVELIVWTAHRYSEMIITSGFRQGDKGVHGQIPCRGIDVRSTVFEFPKAVESDVNAHWRYDPDRPERVCALLHDTGKGMHFHFQVHDKTEYKGG